MADFDTLTAYTVATIAPGTTHIRTAGCYAVGDGGHALWKVIATPSPVKLYHRVSANGVYIEYVPEGRLNPRCIGAKGDNSQNEADYFDAIIALAASRSIYVPGGGAGYRFDRPLTPYAGVVNIEGDGNGQTTSPGQIYNSLATTFLVNFATGYLFVIDHAAPMTFRNILFRGPAPNMTSGGALSFTSSQAGLGCSPIIVGCAFALLHTPILINKCSDPRISERNLFNQWIFAAIKITKGGDFEGGGGVISDNLFIGYVGGSIYGIYSEVGYVKICHNRIVGAAAGFALISTGGSAGSFEVFENQIEEQTSFGILITRTAVTDRAAMVQIKNNQFSNITQGGIYAHIYIVDAIGGDWLDCVDITGNVFRSTLGNSSAYILCHTGQAVTVDNNSIHHFGAGTAVGISVTGAALKAPAMIRNNRVDGLAGLRYDTSTACTIVDQQAMTVATLPTCGQGSQIYVADGTYASNPLSGSGGGTLAVRAGAGVWLG